jgi:parallel beta-helix repeat protein
VTEDLTLYRAASPYHITRDIIVHAGVTLTIEPGTELHFSRGSSLLVYGRLLAEGTAAQPIVFTGEDGVHWGAIAFYSTTEDNRIAHAIVEWTTEETADLRAQGVTAYDSTLTLSYSIVRHTEGSALHLQDSNVHILRNEIYDVWGLWSGLYGDALKADGGQAVVEGNHVYDVHTTGGDGVQFTDTAVPPILRDNHIHHIDDDCVDLNHSSGTLERNVLHDCGDKGISLGHVGTTTLANNLVYRCDMGIAVKDGHQSTLANVTVADCVTGLALYQAHEWEGGGQATVVNSILWSLTTPLDVRDGSTLAVTYSDVQGGAAGEGNITADPLFRSPAGGGYRLREESPCVDAGTAQGAPSDDIKGVLRPVGDGYDMGAHEFLEFFETWLPVVLRDR